MKKTLKTLLIIIFLGVFLFSAYKIVTILKDYKTDADQYESIKGEVMEPRTRRSSDKKAETTTKSGDPAEDTADPKEASGDPEKDTGDSGKETGDPEKETGDPEDSGDPQDDPEAGKTPTDESSYEKTAPRLPDAVKKDIPESVLAGLGSHEHEQALPFLHTWFNYLLVKKYMFNFPVLTRMNSDICGWIRIDGTYVDYPFVQYTDNSTYLRLGPDKKPSNAGTIFVDTRNEKDFTDKNTIMYGHNQQSLRMFHQLLSYKDPEFLKEHPYVDIYLPDGTLNRYLIFASYETEETFPYTCRFDDDNAFKVFLNRCRKASYYDSGIRVSLSDKILTLVTCTKTYNEASRIIVQAVLIQQDK